MNLSELEALARTAAERIEAIEGEDEQAQTALKALAEGGWLRWTVPAAWGGAAHAGVSAEHIGVRALCDARKTFAYASGMLDVMFVEQGLGSYPIALGAAQGKRAPWMEAVFQGVLSGTTISAFALTETGAGSDLTAVATRAEGNADQGWVLNGEKTFISNAGIAGFYTVLARTQGQPGDRDGLSMFYVPAEAEGVSVERFAVMAPHPIGTVRFEDVQLAPDTCLGAPGQGMQIALGTLATFRTSVAAAALGFSRRAFDESVRHLEQRVQFGRPLSAFQGLRFDLAEMDVRLRAGELLMQEAAELVDLEVDSGTEVARAKYYATENASWICDRAVQHLGGLGVKRGQIVERLYREVRALRIYEGTSEVQKLLLGKAALERFREQNAD